MVKVAYFRLFSAVGQNHAMVCGYCMSVVMPRCLLYAFNNVENLTKPKHLTFINGLMLTFVNHKMPIVEGKNPEIFLKKKIVFGIFQDV
jgi:hypothetical protein